ncbi:MAG: MFS transporter [Oscillospiraceae bacterium]|nr:MFS transporter [Oscillospiraceae bacterium]
MDQNVSETRTQKKGLSFALKYLFGVGDAGFVLMSNVETFYFMRFLTTLANFTAPVAALINSVFSIIDAALSWIYGAIINGGKAKKWGRYRSWLVLTPWIVPFIFACQFIRFSENVTLSAVIIVVAAVVSHFIWNLGYVANSAMVAVVGKTPDEKAILASSRATWNNIGSLAFSYLGLPFAAVLAGIVGEKNQFAAVAFVLGIVMVLTYFAHFKMTDGYEDIETEQTVKLTKKNKMKFGEMLKALVRNPHLICLIIADLAKWCVNFVVKASAAYYFLDALNGNTAMQKIYVLTSALGAMVGAYLVRYLAKKLSSRTSMIISYIGMAVFLFLVYLFYAVPTAVIIFISLAFVCYGMALASAPALYADAVTYSTWKDGKDASGWIMGLQNVPLKVAIFLRGVIIGAVLTSINYDTEVKAAVAAGEQLSAHVRQALTIPFALVPAIFCAVGVILLICGFRITRDKVLEYQKEIDARMAAEE